MKNYKDYIGKTFKGFEFEDKEHSNLPYNDSMDEFIGKDLKIQHYHENYNCFDTDLCYSYPADLVIAQLEKQTFKPERGDKVFVWDDNEDMAKERIFLCEIEGASSPYICVSEVFEEDFINGNIFCVNLWKNIKPIQIPKDTLVWCKNNESSLWQQRFYSDFSDGRHYCFLDQKKSNETKETAGWNIVTTENPFE
jgi:hypothetical protein